LIVVPDAHDFPCLNKSEMGLVPVRCEVWRGLVYLNFDKDAEPLADFMAPMAAQATGFPLENLVVKDRYSIEADCNWKVAFDNFLEIYHVRFCHPQSLAPYLNSQSFVVSLFENGHSRHPVRLHRADSVRSGGPDFQRVHHRAANLSQQFLCPGCGGFQLPHFLAHSPWQGADGRHPVRLAIRQRGRQSLLEDHAHCCSGYSCRGYVPVRRHTKIHAKRRHPQSGDGLPGARPLLVPGRN